jgi:serine protease Do
VVEILVSESAERVAVTPDGLGGEDDFARPRFIERSPSALPPPGIPVRGTGSGFIVTADGIIMTSAHVVQAARRVTVRLADDRELDAEIVGADPPTDIALLKVRGVHLAAVTLGNSDDVRVGEWVMAIGSPFGFDHSLRQGIVSAKSRALPGRAYVPFIQTDVLINPGDSGGPLFNARGEVIGINSEVYGGRGDYQGLSFAIPSNIAASVEAQLLRNGKVIRSRLGVTGQEMTQGLADALGRDNLDGVLVSAVEPGGPAAKAGLVPGDVILKLNGREIANAIELPGLVAGFEPGTLVKFDVFHEGATKRIYVTLGRLHDSRKD